MLGLGQENYLFSYYKMEVSYYWNNFKKFVIVSNEASCFYK